jgi:hypothetical protein
MFQTLFSRWLKFGTRSSLIAARHRGRKTRSARSCFTPRLEVLEHRDVPSFVFQTIDHPNAGTTGDGTQGTFPIGINSSGLISGNYGDAKDVTHGFLLSHGHYTTFDDPSAGTAAGQGTNASGLNDRGQVVGLYWDPNSVGHGFLLSHGSYTTLDDPNAAHYTNAVSLNNQGRIVGYYADSGSAIHGFLLSHGQYTTLDDPNAGTAAGQGTFGLGINNEGQISGIYLDAGGVYHGFLLSHGQYTTLDDPNGVQGTVAYGINDRAQIVGYYIDAGSVLHGFVFSHGQYTTLDDPNAAAGAFQGTVPVGISASGKIVGSYIDSNNLDHGFLATQANDDSDPEAPNMLVAASSSQTNPGNTLGTMSTGYPTAVVAVWSPLSDGDNGGSSQIVSTPALAVGRDAVDPVDAAFASNKDIFGSYTLIP